LLVQIQIDALGMDLAEQGHEILKGAAETVD
jgi:hypothetical protein